VVAGVEVVLIDRGVCRRLLAGGFQGAAAVVAQRWARPERAWW
jgi:hypothetical protein